MMGKMNLEFIKTLVDIIPEDFLSLDEEIDKKLYLDFLMARLSNAETFVKEAENARKALI
jgi:hypothetical protein